MKFTQKGRAKLAVRLMAFDKRRNVEAAQGARQIYAEMLKCKR